MAIGHKVKDILHPMYKQSKQVRFDIFSAKHGSPVSCLESGVKREGTIVVAVPEYSGAQRSVRRDTCGSSLRVGYLSSLPRRRWKSAFRSVRR